MLRVLGVGCILCGCMGLGIYYRNRLGEHLMELQEMIQVLVYMESEIWYQKATLPESCIRTAKRVNSPFSEALAAIYKKQNEEEFHHIWKLEMGKALYSSTISKEEKRIFLEFGEVRNIYDNSLQLRMIEQYRDRLKSHAANRERERKEQGRIATCLGLMSGILLVIILL